MDAIIGFVIGIALCHYFRPKNKGDIVLKYQNGTEYRIKLSETCATVNISTIGGGSGGSGSGPTNGTIKEFYP